MKIKMLRFETGSSCVSNFSDVCISDSVFGYPFKPSLIHQVISSYLINSRKGSKAQKNRSEVSGSNKKPWRQKGTGHARAGSVKSPIWRSGGVTFACKPKKYIQKINKKMYRGAIKSILSKLVCDNRIFLVEDLFIDQPKTKLLLERIRKIVLDKSVLIITDFIDNNIRLSSRNLYKVSIGNIFELNPVSLVNFEVTLFTQSVINKLEQRFV